MTLAERLGNAILSRGRGYLTELAEWGLDPEDPANLREFLVLDLLALAMGESLDILDEVETASAAGFDLSAPCRQRPVEPRRLGSSITPCSVD